MRECVSAGFSLAGFGPIEEERVLRDGRSARWQKDSAVEQKPNVKSGRMNALDLTKATLACGTMAFLVYSFPVIGQVVIIGGLTLVWLSYAYKTLRGTAGK
jgi:hypothetical protein